MKVVDYIKTATTATSSHVPVLQDRLDQLAIAVGVGPLLPDIQQLSSTIKVMENVVSIKIDRDCCDFHKCSHTQKIT